MMEQSLSGSYEESVDGLGYAPSSSVGSRSKRQQLNKREYYDYDNRHFRDRITQYFDNIKKNYNYSTQDIGWIQEYLYWHDDMRRHFPGYSIFEDPKAPKIAICVLDDELGSLHGLTDRLQDIGHLLRHCHKERRVLFYAWYNAPLALESFLIPNLFNWTLPYEHPNTATAKRLLWKTGNIRTRRDLVKNRKLGDQSTASKVRIFENHLPSLGEYLYPFHVFWHAYFRPSHLVQQMIDEVMQQQNLIPFQYDAVHMRVGHPAFRNKNQYNEDDRKLDYYGNKFTDEMATLCMDSAARAVACAKWLGNSNMSSSHTPDLLPIYFYSDSPELTRSVMNPKSFLPSNSAKISADTLYLQRQAWSNLSNTTSNYPSRIVGRPDASIAHVSKVASNQSPAELATFASTFVDLYIASRARCVNLGVGRYAYLAAKVGGRTCWAYHARTDPHVSSRWGMNDMITEVPACPLVSQ